MPRPEPSTGESIFFAVFYFGVTTWGVAQVTPNWGWWVAGGLALVGLLVLYGFRRALQNHVAKRRLGPLFVGLPPSAVAGEALPLLIRLNGTERGLAVEGVRLRLVQRRGQDERTLAEWEVCGARHVSPADPLQLTQDLPLDPDLAPTGWDGEEASYWIEVEVEIANWPDWFHRYPIRLRAPQEPENTGPVVATALVGKIRARAGTVPASPKCPYCREDLADVPREALLQCGSCHTVLHAECVHELGRCTTVGCANSQRRRRRDRARARA